MLFFILRVEVASEKFLAQIQQINCLWKTIYKWRQHLFVS